MKSGKSVPSNSSSRQGTRSSWSGGPAGPNSLIISPPPREQIPDFPPVQIPREDDSEEEDEDDDDDDEDVDDDEDSDSRNHIVDMDQGHHKRRKY